MKHYCQFYHLSTGYVRGTKNTIDLNNRKPIPACGTDSVMILDSRLTLSNMIEKAKQYASKTNKHYIGFIIYRGNFLKGSPITKYIKIS